MATTHSLVAEVPIGVASSSSHSYNHRLDEASSDLCASTPASKTSLDSLRGTDGALSSALTASPSTPYMTIMPTSLSTKGVVANPPQRVLSTDDTSYTHLGKHARAGNIRSMPDLERTLTTRSLSEQDLVKINEKLEGVAVSKQSSACDCVDCPASKSNDAEAQEGVEQRPAVVDDGHLVLETQATSLHSPQKTLQPVQHIFHNCSVTINICQNCLHSLETSPAHVRPSSLKPLLQRTTGVAVTCPEGHTPSSQSGWQTPASNMDDYTVSSDTETGMLLSHQPPTSIRRPQVKKKSWGKKARSLLPRFTSMVHVETSRGVWHRFEMLFDSGSTANLVSMNAVVALGWKDAINYHPTPPNTSLSGDPINIVGSIRLRWDTGKGTDRHSDVFFVVPSDNAAVTGLLLRAKESSDYGFLYFRASRRTILPPQSNEEKRRRMQERAQRELDRLKNEQKVEDHMRQREDEGHWRPQPRVRGPW